MDVQRARFDKKSGKPVAFNPGDKEKKEDVTFVVKAARISLK